MREFLFSLLCVLCEISAPLREIRKFCVDKTRRNRYNQLAFPKDAFKCAEFPRTGFLQKRFIFHAGN